MIPFTDLTVAEGNYYGSRDGRTIDMIVLHTMVGTVESANGRFNNPAAQVSAHRGIGFSSGIQYRWVEDWYTAYHAGDWEVNLRSLGIEHEDMGDYNGVRPDILYSLSGSVVAEMVQQYPAIKLDRFHVVPGICDHRDVHATACPDALDTERIIWIAKRIVEGVNPVAEFDPRNVQADKDWFDNRVRELMMNEPQLVAYAMSRITDPYVHPQMKVGPGSFKPVTSLAAPEKRDPDHHMRGTPPAGHPAHERREGIHKPEKEEKK